MIEIRDGLGVAPRVGTDAGEWEKAVEAILSDALRELASATPAVRDAWVILRLFTRINLSGGYGRPMAELVEETLRRVLAAGTGGEQVLGDRGAEAGQGGIREQPGRVVESIKLVRVGGEKVPLGIYAEWMFSPRAVPGWPSASFFADLTIRAMAWLLRGVREKGRAPQWTGLDVESLMPPTRVGVIISELLSTEEEAAQVEGARAFAYLQEVGQLPVSAIVRVGERLPRLCPAALAIVCPAMGNELEGSANPDKVLARRRIAMCAGGVGLFHPQSEARQAVGTMLAKWKADPVVSEGFARVLEAERDDPNDRPTIPVADAAEELELKIPSVHYHIEKGNFGPVALVGGKRLLTRNQIEQFKTRTPKMGRPKNPPL